MARSMKVRTRTQEGEVEVLVLITHPMETGQRKDKNSGEKITAHFIRNVSVELNGKLAATAELGTGISENPLLGFRLAQAKNGDKIKVSWSDNKGENGVHEGTVSL